MENNFKVVINCPLCEKKELQVVEDNNVQLMQCISCGYSTNSNLMGKKEENELWLGLDEKMKRWSKEANDQIWIPSIMNMEVGMMYPVENSNGDMVWAFAASVDISEEERENYPIPGQDGKFYEKKFDTDNEVRFETFRQGILELNTILEATAKVQKEKENVKLKLPELKTIEVDGEEG